MKTKKRAVQKVIRSSKRKTIGVNLLKYVSRKKEET